jgi:hypothetical protein
LGAVQFAIGYNRPIRFALRKKVTPLTTTRRGVAFCLDVVLDPFQHPI